MSIRIPGPFVVLQGVPGDGVLNTMDHLPSLESFAGVPLNVIGSTLQGLFPALRKNPNDTAVAEELDSFVVVDDDNEESRKSARRLPSSSPQRAHRGLDETILAQWTQECHERTRADHREWQNMCQENQRMDPQEPVLADQWWLMEGKVAVLDGLPTAENKPQVIGQLAPGSTVQAVALCTLDSGKLSPLAVSALPDGSYPPARRGWMQVLRLDGPQSRYVVLSRDGYSYLGAGTPEDYTDPLQWLWRVTCVDGAYVREGLDLSTSHIGTIPYGALVHVRGKTLNNMGLSRLQVAATIPHDRLGTVEIQGWCSEFLNPLSGQRGAIVQPLPFCVPAIYKVALPTAAVIRSGIELSSPDIGFAPSGAIVTVTGRAYSEHPTERCIERLRLTGDGGWISLRLNKNPPHDVLICEQDGVDQRYDPERPGVFHLQSLRRVQESQEATVVASNHRRSVISPPTISSVDDDDDDDGGLSSESTDSLGSCLIHEESLEPASLSCTYTRAVSNRSLTKRHESESSALPSRQQPATCLVCLSEEQTAMIVHGGTGHIACCLMCARILKAKGDPCPVCRAPIESVIQHFFA